MPRILTCIGLDDLPEIRRDDDLAGLTFAAARRAGATVAHGDVFVFCQKIVSKAEGRLIDLATVKPGAEAIRLGETTCKDPRIVELVLGETQAVIRAVPNILLVRHRLGFTLANAGIDQSNLPDGERQALLLPVDPDASARRLRREIARLAGVDVAVVINDSLGRPWRRGTCGTAIGCDGMAAVVDLRGRKDRAGRVLRSSESAVADEVAAAASLAMGQADESCPVVLVRGLSPSVTAVSEPASAILRAAGEDLFR